MNPLLAVFPAQRRDWGEAYLAEFPSGVGLWRVLVYAWYSTIKGGNPMKTTVITASIMNSLFGLFVIGLYLFTEDNPTLVLALGVSMILQGGYTLWYTRKREGSVEPLATRALLSGQTVALLVGLGGLLISTINQLAIDTTDPEYGPMAVAGVIAFHAVVTLYFFGLKGGAVEVEAPNRS